MGNKSGRRGARLHCKGKDVTTPASGDLDRDKQGDNWYIGIDNREFSIVPGAFVLGGGWAW